MIEPKTHFTKIKNAKRVDPSLKPKDILTPEEYEEHKLYYRINAKTYYQNNKEKCKERCREWYDKNREKFNELAVKRYKKDPSRWKRSSAAYYRKKKETIKKILEI